MRVRQAQNIRTVGKSVNGFRIERERVGSRLYWHAVRQDGPGLPISACYAFQDSRKEAERKARAYAAPAARTDEGESE